jgi:hypothetical protein
MSDVPSNDGVERQIQRLSAERTALFAKGSSDGPLTDADRRRLREIEQTLDECFKARRAQRAARDANRFARSWPITTERGVTDLAGGHTAQR